jgi:hypothetical protein
MPAHHGTLILAQEPAKHYSPEQRAAVKHWAVWTGGMVLGAMLVIGIVLVVLDRQRRAIVRATERKRKKARAMADAWAESGKRMDPDAIGSRDDTVDIDPEDFGPHDVDGEGERDPHGEGPHG